MRPAMFSAYSPPALTLGLCAALVTAGLGGCMTAPPRVYSHSVAVAPIAPPSTQVMFYPNAGQSPEQQDRDRYECYRWAVQQARFDPGAPQVPPHQRVDVVSATPPGANTAAGAVTGAILGAAVARPRNAGGGAILGAVTGAIIGANSDAQNTAQTQRLQERYDAREAQLNAQLDQQADKFRRATSACLEARGYTVR